MRAVAVASRDDVGVCTEVFELKLSYFIKNNVRVSYILITLTE